MPKIQPKLVIELDPSKPVQEICDIITAVSAYHPNSEIQILSGIRDAISARISELEVQL